MLSSIHPLGERARHNRWLVTVGAFTAASTITGALVGASLGLAGAGLASGLSDGSRLVLIGALTLLAGLFDWFRLAPPGPTRQVNEHWIGYYRGWVYGGAFGAQLGLGLGTYVVTWGVYAVLLSEFLLGSWTLGAAVGAVFGFGRSIAPITAGWIDRPSRLSAYIARMARLGRPVRHAGALVTTGLATIALLGAAL